MDIAAEVQGIDISSQWLWTCLHHSECSICNSSFNFKPASLCHCFFKPVFIQWDHTQESTWLAVRCKSSPHKSCGGVCCLVQSATMKELRIGLTDDLVLSLTRTLRQKNSNSQHTWNKSMACTCVDSFGFHTALGWSSHYCPKSYLRLLKAIHVRQIPQVHRLRGHTGWL